MHTHVRTRTTHIHITYNTHAHTHTHTQSHSPAHHPSPPQPTREPAVTEQSRGDEGGAWKEAFQKLRADFEEFKESCLKDIRVLTDDLDEERKARAMLVIDIDRLKKARGNR